MYMLINSALYCNDFRDSFQLNFQNINFKKDSLRKCMDVIGFMCGKKIVVEVSFKL